MQETEHEVTECLEKWHQRPLKCLEDWGLADDHLIAVHMTQTNEEDKQILKKTGAHIAHCPQSNMKLASGICPVQVFNKAGINISIGTDGACSNNDLSMLDEIRSAALLAKIHTADPTAVSTWDALEMATINGAKALGIDEVVGSLTPGKAADVIAINADDFAMLPLFQPSSQIVYSAQTHHVTDVFVAGKPLMRNGKLTTMDEAALKATAHAWANKIK